MPDYWIFVATNHRIYGQVLDAKETYATGMKDRFWGSEKELRTESV